MKKQFPLLAVLLLFSTVCATGNNPEPKITAEQAETLIPYEPEADLQLKATVGQEAQQETSIGFPLQGPSNLPSTPDEPETDLQLKATVGQEAHPATLRGIPLNRHAYPLNIEIGGYVKSEGFYDSRQNDEGGDGQYLLFPKKIDCDPTGRDINHHAQFSMTSIETRANFVVSGPEIFSAKARGVTEWDFWGSGIVIRRPRLRHGFIRLDWEDVSFLTGQFWHPIFVDECYADTISFNSGAPLDPYARNPQVRITPQFGDVKLILAAIAQVNNVSNGPIGYSSTYMRNAHMPDLHAQAQLFANKHVFGAGFDFKRLVPRLESDTGYKVDESINSVAAIGYIALNFENFRIHTKASFVQNGTEFDNLSGYAVHCIDPVTDGREYANLRSACVWMDIILKHNACEPAIFAGYTKNLGANKTIIPKNPVTGESLIYALDPNIAAVWRISPRVRWYFDPFVIGIEFEYTNAAHGTVNNKGNVDDARPVGNFRSLAAAWYNF